MYWLYQQAVALLIGCLRMIVRQEGTKGKRQTPQAPLGSCDGCDSRRMGTVPCRSSTYLTFPSCMHGRQSCLAVLQLLLPFLMGACVPAEAAASQSGSRANAGPPHFHHAGVQPERVCCTPRHQHAGGFPVRGGSPTWSGACREGLEAQAPHHHRARLCHQRP